MTRTMLFGLLAAVALCGIAAPAPAQPKDKDLAAKAKALMILSCGDKSECHLTKKAAELLVVAKAEALAPPKEKKAAPKAPCPNCGPDACPNGACGACPGGKCGLAPSPYPVIPGYQRGPDGVYRPAGLVQPQARR